MADSGIKKIIIKKQDLPNFIGDNAELAYSLKYRVVSDDKNKTSHWSPIYKLISEDTGDETGFDPNDPENTSIPHQVIIEKSRHTAECSWTMPSLLIPNPTEEEKILQQKQAAIKEFDVYIQWQMINNNANSWTDWIWVGNATTTQFSISYNHPAPPYHIKFRIQKVTSLKQAFDAATYLVSNEHEL